MRTKEEYIEGLRCEECYPRPFGSPVNNSPDNLYLYIDMSGSTRCFCKKHMSYGKYESSALLDYEDKWDYPYYGAKLISEILKEEE